MSAFQFNAEQVKPDEGRMPPIPKGNYPMIMTDSPIKPTSNGSGSYIAGVFKVVGGQYDGHTVYHNFNVRNQSEKAMEIAYAQLSALCHAVGVLNISDTVQLHNRVFEASLKIGGGGKADDGSEYEQRNEITGFRKITGNAPMNQAPTAPVAPPAFVPPAQQHQAPVQQPWTQGPPPAQQPQFQPPVQQAPQQMPWAGQQAPQQPWQQQAPQQAPAYPQMPVQPPMQTSVPEEYVEQQNWANQNPVVEQAPQAQQQQPQHTGPASGITPPWQKPAQ